MISQNNNLANDIFKTLCYADIFDYPLTKKELFRFLISKNQVSQKVLSEFLKNYIPGVGTSGKYFFLNGKRNLVAVRQKRIIESKKKMEKAKRISSLLSFIPFVQCIGVSGSLSMNNSKKNDDIDLFIITSKKRLWVTRFLVVIILALVGQRRKRKDTVAADKICPNMFVSEDSMKITKRNLFSAHEVVQLKILWNKNNTYEKFLTQNKWVKKFLPNFMPYALDKTILPKAIETRNNLSTFLDKLELLFYIVQRAYMRSHMTSEEVQLSVARFHPRDMKQYVLQLYSLKYRYISKNTVGTETNEYSRILT